MKLINNWKSLTGGDNLEFETLYQLNNFPVRMGATEDAYGEDIYANMTYIIDKNTGMIQLGELVPLDVLYQDAHYNNIASSWKEHHQAFSDFIMKYSPRNIFEIGGGTGLLSKYYTDVVPDSKWTILEAAPNPADGCKAEYVKGIFDENFIIPSGFDAVVHTHTMEHFYNPLEVIRNISDAMSDGSYMFFSIPNLEEMYKRNYTNVLNFEHTYFCTEPYVTNILLENGYMVIERKLFKEEHSVFYAAVKGKKQNPENKYLSCYDINKKLFNGWKSYHERLIAEINEKINEVGKSNVFLFGAHVFAQYLLAFGLRQDRIVAVLDNDPCKQGKRLYGTRYQVCPCQRLQNEVNPIVVLHAGTHNDEIKKDILGINPTTFFV